MGKRGSVEDVTTRVSGVMKSSKLLTDAGVPHVTMVLHPTEGLIFSGEVKVTRQMMDLVNKQGLESKMKEDTMWQGGNLIHMSTRWEKELMLSRLYECKLPPMPMPFSDLRTTSLPLLQAQFGKILEAELTGVRYKLGDPLPPNISEWFTYGQEVFECIKGSTYTRGLPGLLSNHEAFFNNGRNYDLQSKLSKLIRLIMLRFVEGKRHNGTEVLPRQPGGGVQAALGGVKSGGVQPGKNRGGA